MRKLIILLAAGLLFSCFDTGIRGNVLNPAAHKSSKPISNPILTSKPEAIFTEKNTAVLLICFDSSLSEIQIEKFYSQFKNCGPAVYAGALKFSLFDLLKPDILHRHYLPKEKGSPSEADPACSVIL